MTVTIRPITFIEQSPGIYWSPEIEQLFNDSITSMETHTTITTQLRVDLTDNILALNQRMDDHDAAMVNYVDIPLLETERASVDSKLALKADLTDLDNYVLKSTYDAHVLVAATLTDLSLKADITYVDDELAAKADLAATTTALADLTANKADLIDGKVPTSQLPNTIDDIQEYANFAAFPGTGLVSVIYLDLETMIQYRWSGSAYVATGSSLALGETALTAYRGDLGALALSRATVAYNHALEAHAPADTDARYVQLNSDADLSSVIIDDLHHIDSDAIASLAVRAGHRYDNGSGDLVATEAGYPVAIVAKTADGVTDRSKYEIHMSTGQVANGGVVTLEQVFALDGQTKEATFAGRVSAQELNTLPSGSKASLKKNIQPFLGNARQIIDETEIVSYEWIDEGRVVANKDRIGFIADHTNPLLAGSNQSFFDTDNILGVALKAIQELSTEVTSLKNQLRVLQPI